MVNTLKKIIHIFPLMFLLDTFFFLSIWMLNVFEIADEFMTYDKQEESMSQADLSSSSLRRKLFFQGDTSSIVSPVK